jgi:hypothetical protein
MKQNRIAVAAGALFLVALAGSAVSNAQTASAESAAAPAGAASRGKSGTWATPRALAPKAAAAGTSTASPHADAADLDPISITTQAYPGSASALPLWTYSARSPRDGHRHHGTLVGTDPFTDPGSSSIPMFIIPLILRTHTLGTTVDLTTGIISTTPGEATFDPTEPDHACMTSPNNVPLTVIQQSPLFNPAHFVFGGTDVGTTQYEDAFQRAAFWTALGPNASKYHVLLGPVTVLDPVEIDVPPNEGLAITNPAAFIPGFTFCGPAALIDINWLDSYVNGTLLPAAAKHGANSSTLPMFITYNAAYSSPVTNLFTCCAIGYHGLTVQAALTQAYSVSDFDMTGFFGGPLPGLQTIVLSHEIGEWINDPLVSNYVTPWGNTGQVFGCSEYLEVGDPLTGSLQLSVTMPNGFDYYLQELAFFSWFTGGSSFGVNGWYSNNGTFLTDAGPPCP